MSDFSYAPTVQFPVADIIVPENRQRKNAKADAALVSSIDARGLINPIILRDGNVLVAGERRLDAHRQLCKTHIAVRNFEALNTRDAHLVELQENLQRSDLTWQEQVQAIADYHELCLAEFAGWTLQGTAGDLGFSKSWISDVLTVSRQMHDEDIRSAVTFKGALNLIGARADRVLAAAQARGLATADAASTALIPADATKEEKTALLLDAMDDSIFETIIDTGTLLDKVERAEDAAKLLAAQAIVEREESNDERVIQASFLDWAPSYSGPRFDVLHCDFPYGKNYSGSNTRKTGRATSVPTYADSADVYFALVETLLTEQDRLLLPQAHCIFWMDMIHYCWTVEAFTSAGWRLTQPHPLIWTKSYQGVAADPKRRPRHCYETALLFSRGDRLLRKLDKDHYEEQVDEKLHMSQKPIKMLRHFLQLVVDEHTAVLDPTCGSGTSLAAAGQLGAARLLGVELEESHCDIARFMLQRELPADA